MAGLFNRLKIWSSLEIVKNADLNAEFDNIINNLGPAGMSGWSATVAQMQVQTSPGTFGSESLATSLNGELERIRYQLNAIIGGPDNVWYDQPQLSISQINQFLPSTPPNNRIVSGSTLSSSKLPNHLQASGSTASVSLNGSVTPFICVINGTTYTFNTNITLGSLSTAPTSSNTFTLNDTNCNLSAASSNFGAYVADISAALNDKTEQLFNDYPITGNAVGTAIQGLANTYQAFSYTHSAVTEYFIGFCTNVSSSTITVSKALRGFFLNSSSVGIPAIPLNNSEAVTLCNLAWIYVTTAGTLLAVYTHPRYSPVQPVTSASGDMWYDMVNQQWKQSNGSTYSVANAVLVGVCVMNGTACVAARSFDWYRSYTSASNVIPEWYSTAEFRTKYDNNSLNVYGGNLQFDHDTLRWTSTNLETGTTLTNSTSYYLYVSETGAPWVSKYFPHRRYDLNGYYHPFNSWRCLGVFLYNGSGQFDPNIYFPLSGLNAEQINDKSLSISKLKPTSPLIYDLNATTPLVAGVGQISYSTIITTTVGGSTLVQIQDANSKNVSCSLACTGGRFLMVGLQQDYLTPSTASGLEATSNANSGQNNGIMYYYLDGVQVSNFPVGIGVPTWAYEPSLNMQYGTTIVFIPNVTPGIHTLTLYWVGAQANSEFVFTNVRMFMKEL